MKVVISASGTNYLRICINDSHYFFSYSTLVGFSGMVNGELVEVQIKFGSTSSRHMGVMGGKNYRVVTTNEFAAIVAMAQ